jgi:hypothetical protein
VSPLLVITLALFAGLSAAVVSQPTPTCLCTKLWIEMSCSFGSTPKEQLSLSHAILLLMLRHHLQPSSSVLKKSPRPYLYSHFLSFGNIGVTVT